MEDAHNDYKLMSESRKGNRTTVKFSRLLTTCDKDDLEISVKIVVLMIKPLKCEYYCCDRIVRKTQSNCFGLLGHSNQLLQKRLATTNQIIEEVLMLTCWKKLFLSKRRNGTKFRIIFYKIQLQSTAINSLIVSRGVPLRFEQNVVLNGNTTLYSCKIHKSLLNEKNHIIGVLANLIQTFVSTYFLSITRLLLFPTFSFSMNYTLGQNYLGNIRTTLAS